eukprot:m.147711 g.147711  ORF g.147711 m.147711 type:complete len:903 (-) comp16270_c0_seq5:84-2792(-)
MALRPLIQKALSNCPDGISQLGELLSNRAADDSYAVFMSLQGIDVIFNTLQGQNDDLTLEAALKVLEEVARNNDDNAQAIVNHSALSSTLQLFDRTRSPSVKQGVVILIAILAETRGKELLQLNVLEYLKVALVPTQTTACRQAAASSLWHISAGEGEPMKVMMQQDVLPPLITCLHDADSLVLQRALGCLANLALFDAVLLTHKHCVPACATLLHQSKDIDVQAEAAAVLWNLAGRSPKAAQELLARDQAIAVICQHLINTPDLRLRRSCLGIVANLNNLPGASAAIMAEGVGPACVRFCSPDNEKEIRESAMVVLWLSTTGGTKDSQEHIARIGALDVAMDVIKTADETHPLLLPALGLIENMTVHFSKPLLGYGVLERFNHYMGSSFPDEIRARAAMGLRGIAFLGHNLETVFDASRELVIETLKSNLESDDLVNSCSSVLANLCFTKNQRILAWFQDILPDLVETYDSAPASHFAMLVVFFNMALYGSDDTRATMRDAGVHTRLHSQMMDARSKDDPMQLQAACGIAMLVGHIESHPSLKIDARIMTMFRDALECALKEEPYKSVNSVPEALLKPLQRLAVNDDNKRIVADVCTDILLNILDPKYTEYSKGSDEESQTLAAEILAAVLFSTSLDKHRLERVKTILQHLQQAGSEPVKEQAALALFNLTEKPKSSSEADLAKSKHVMISYNWTHQAFALKVKAWMEKAGYSVWIDVDQMQGSILEAMSHAIEGAGLVIFILSEQYKESNACRTEAEYAYRLKKPMVPVKVNDYTPTGWLGALCGNKLYYDFRVTVAADLPADAIAQADAETKAGFMKEVTQYMKAELKRRATALKSASNASTTAVDSAPALALGNVPTDVKTLLAQIQEQQAALATQQEDILARLQQLEGQKSGCCAIM